MRGSPSIGPGAQSRRRRRPANDVVTQACRHASTLRTHASAQAPMHPPPTQPPQPCPTSAHTYCTSSLCRYTCPYITANKKREIESERQRENLQPLRCRRRGGNHGRGRRNFGFDGPGIDPCVAARSALSLSLSPPLSITPRPIGAGMVGKRVRTSTAGQSEANAFCARHGAARIREMPKTAPLY